MGFGPRRQLLSAVELDLFTCLGDESLTGEEVGRQLGQSVRGRDL